MVAKARIEHGDCREVLAGLAPGSVHVVVTSPPYWGLRDYGLPASVWADGWEGVLGLEPTPSMYVRHLVEVFRQVRRVLHSEGTLWLNLGDTYVSAACGDEKRHRSSTLTGGNKHRVAQRASQRDHDWQRERDFEGLPTKSLVGIPWRVAFALQEDGWLLRAEIIWHKPNPMPESVNDRPSRAHEHLFLLTQEPHYYYDAYAIREAGSAKTLTVNTQPWKGTGVESAGEKVNRWMAGQGGRYHAEGRNARTVWSIAAEPLPEAHFAAFPAELPTRCIRAGTSDKGCCPLCGRQWRRKLEALRRATRPGRHNLLDASSLANRDPRRHVTQFRTVGWEPACDCNIGCIEEPSNPIPATVLDPFCGSARTGVAARRLGRDFIGIDLSPEYCRMARAQIGRALEEGVGGPVPDVPGQLLFAGMADPIRGVLLPPELQKQEASNGAED